jgi:hypothetical protein
MTVSLLKVGENGQLRAMRVGSTKIKSCPQLIFWGRRFFVVRVDVSQHFIEGAVIEISQLTKGVRSLSAPLSHQLRNVRHSTKFQARHDVETDRMEGSEKPRWQNRN